MQIGNYKLSLGLALAPMTGISDKPFRKMCKRFGASWVVSEMISGDPTLRHTHKTIHRLLFSKEDSPKVIQVIGNQPKKMAEAARFYAQQGADVIDINMGCPAKKVCQSYAGSALLQNEELIKNIITAVVEAVEIPVTLKTRLGWDDDHLNILKITEIAENNGIKALAIHGRSRTQMFQGEAKYELIKKVADSSELPIWVNGDIDSAEKAAKTLSYTGADGVMIGRAAQGQPWIFHEIKEFLQSGKKSRLPFEIISRTIKEHLEEIYDFYAGDHGYRIARKHIGWYFSRLTNNKKLYQNIFTLDNSKEQLNAVVNLLGKPEIEDGYYTCTSLVSR